MRSGAWFGSMIPPAPTRILEVPAATCADDDRGGGTRDPRHPVMLGEPEAPVAQSLGMPGQVEGAAERVGGVGAFDDGRQVEDGQGNHAANILPCVSRRAAPPGTFPAPSVMVSEKPQRSTT